MLFGPARARDTPPRARWRRQGVGVVRGTPVCTNRYARVRPSAPQLNFGDAASYGLVTVPACAGLDGSNERRKISAKHGLPHAERLIISPHPPERMYCPRLIRSTWMIR